MQLDSIPNGFSTQDLGFLASYNNQRQQKRRPTPTQRAALADIAERHLTTANHLKQNPRKWLPAAIRKMTRATEDVGNFLRHAQSTSGALTGADTDRQRI